MLRNLDEKIFSINYLNIPRDVKIDFEDLQLIFYSKNYDFVPLPVTG